ncbi:hypothetical protein COCNU_06G014460 [Cocos nucifera]|uniref:Uncharacterized protein n=1 Tax=Cocos nucifera TaxID=13894 RepID=A0A8K0N413_COCNU|nr:hypothetical protein COCNU_06G014460 [Cocos nucifera]
MVLVPFDWIERKSHPLDEIVGSTYTSLLGLAHDVTILNMGLVAFNQVKFLLEEKLWASEARMKVVKEAKKATEEKAS